MQKKNMKTSVENVITVLRNQGKTVYEMSHDNGEEAFFYEELDAEMGRQYGVELDFYNNGFLRYCVHPGITVFEKAFLPAVNYYCQLISGKTHGHFIVDEIGDISFCIEGSWADGPITEKQIMSLIEISLREVRGYYDDLYHLACGRLLEKSDNLVPKRDDKKVSREETTEYYLESIENCEMFLNREGKNSVYTSFEQHRGFNACMYVGTGDNVYKIKYAIDSEGFASVTVYPEKQMVIPKGREYEAAFVLNKFSRTMKSGHFFIGGIEGYNYSLHVPYIDSPISEESFERMEMIGIMMASETIEEMKLLCTGMPKQTDDTSSSYKSFVQDMIKRSKRRKKKKKDENEPKGFMDLIIGDNPDYSTDAEDVSGFDEDEILITDDENEISMGEFAKNLEKEGKECKGNNDDGEE